MDSGSPSLISPEDRISALKPPPPIFLKFSKPSFPESFEGLLHGSHSSVPRIRTSPIENSCPMRLLRSISASISSCLRVSDGSIFVSNSEFAFRILLREIRETCLTALRGFLAVYQKPSPVAYRSPSRPTP